jgi:hypothetical protein
MDHSVTPVYDVPALFQTDLIELEKILWTGRPEAKPLIGWDLMAVPFGLLILVFCIVFILGVSGLISPEHKLSWTALFLLPAIPVLLMGFKVGFMFSFDPFVSRIWEIPNTYYAVTDQRVITLCTVPKRTFHAVAIKEISDSRTVVYKNGLGRIDFIGDPTKLRKTPKDVLFGFTNIQDVSTVDKLIENLRKQS